MPSPRSKKYDDLEALLKEHGDCYTVARLLCVSETAIRKAAKVRGIELNPIGRPLSAEGDEWVRMVEAGFDVKELAEIYGKSETTIYEALRRRGVFCGGRHRKKHEDGGQLAKPIDQTAELERLRSLAEVQA